MATEIIDDPNPEFFKGGNSQRSPFRRGTSGLPLALSLARGGTDTGHRFALINEKVRQVTPANPTIEHIQQTKITAVCEQQPLQRGNGFLQAGGGSGA